MYLYSTQTADTPSREGRLSEESSIKWRWFQLYSTSPTFRRYILRTATTYLRVTALSCNYGQRPEEERPV